MNRNVALVSIMSSLFLAGKWITWRSNNQQIKNIFWIINLPKLYTHTRILTHLLLRQQLYTQPHILWDGIWEEPDRTFCQKKKKKTTTQKHHFLSQLEEPGCDWHCEEPSRPRLLSADCSQVLTNRFQSCLC